MCSTLVSYASVTEVCEHARTPCAKRSQAVTTCQRVSIRKRLVQTGHKLQQHAKVLAYANALCKQFTSCNNMHQQCMRAGSDYSSSPTPFGMVLAMQVNPVREKKLTNVRNTGSEEKVSLSPPRVFTLEDAIGATSPDTSTHVLALSETVSHAGLLYAPLLYK